jgi:hypothetical protein
VRSILVVLIIGLGVTHAAPKPKPKPPALSAELTKFASEMSTAFDSVYVQVAVAKKHEASNKFAEASAAWRGVYEGAKLLLQQTQRAGAAGAFQDPMTFSTKAGKLTPAKYVAELRKLQATGDVGWTKAAERDDQLTAKRARLTYVASIATQVMSLESIAKTAAQASKRNPESAQIALSNVARGAAALRTSVMNASKLKRAPADAKYPVTPKPLSATELAARLSSLEKTSRKDLAAVDKILAAKPKPAATTKVAAAPTPSGGGGGRTPSTPAPSGGGDPAETAAAPAAPECAPQGDNNCDGSDHLPCCEGSRCLPAGWTTNGTDAEGFPTVEPEYFACQDPDLAPKH